MSDKGVADSIGCGAPLGSSGHIMWFCGESVAGLCEKCQRRRNADPNAWTCPGCDYQIVEGQHFMHVAIRIDTRMPDDWQPVVDVSETILNVRLHNPVCLVMYLGRNELIKNVFAR